jgi:hypothetical protein
MSKDITLPSELIEHDLTPSEIGSIFILFSLVDTNEYSPEVVTDWASNRDFLEAIQSISRKGILEYGDDGKWTIDLTRQEVFWEKGTDSLTGNTIYKHERYIALPYLWKDSIRWMLMDDIHVNSPSNRLFETLELAREEIERNERMERETKLGSSEGS